MRVSKCCEEKKMEQPVELSFEEIKEHEGVYRAVNGEGGSDSRFVVFRGLGVAPAVLWCNNKAAEPAQSCWSRYKFIKTNETVCFEIKGAS